MKPIGSLSGRVFTAIVATLVSVLLIMIGYFFYSVTEIRNIAPQPYVTIVNNNLSAKVKLLSFKNELLGFQKAPSNQALSQLKLKARVLRASILQDFQSNRTIEAHQQYGDIKRLTELSLEIEGVFTRIESVTLESRALLDNLSLQLNGVYSRLNTYLSSFVSEVQKNQMQFLLYKENLHNKQYLYLVIILVCSLLMVGVISWMYLNQSRLSQHLREQTQAMQQAKLLAEQSATTKARFLANMSHEMRTPLNAIIGLSQKEYYLAADQQTRHFLTLINSSGQHLLKLINSVLDISKIEQGKVALHLETFLFSELVAASKTIFIDMNKPQVEVLFTTDAAEDFTLRADQTKLLQIINNISYNAVKFTHQGLVEIRLSVDTQQQLTIKIKDTGIGMSEEQLGRVFEEFTQADDSITRQYGGSGLGLSICQSLVQLMGGQLSVTSQLNQGTEFVIQIPVEVVERQPLIDMQRTALAVNVVAPNIHAQKVITTELSQLGLFDPDANFTVYYQSHEATLEAGLQLVQTEHLQGLLVVADLNMVVPESDGVVKLTKPYDLFTMVASLQTMQSGIAHPSSTQTLHIGDHVKVLLVEDMRVNQIVATKMLSLLGVSWQTANNGKECLDKLKNEHFDLVFMDIQMPVMDGIQALEQIKQQELAPDTVIIALTANTFDSDVSDYLERGFADVLAKPFQLESMVAMIKRYLPAYRAVV
ncbi:ATP-binding protein [Vibrio sinaloensis]|nr:ATP-binding protein [Vibrio sinaloensis]UPQ90312.1 ATP-binding protein [Vibrio sinaloensis]